MIFLYKEELAIIEINQLLPEQTGKSDACLTLPFELRRKSRLRVRLDDGSEAGLFLPRGSILRQGDRLQASNGMIILVKAAVEPVSTVTSRDSLILMRAAYHLGNRHVALQIDSERLRYLHDHVLDTMLEQMGLSVIREQAPFEPEAGAYGGSHHHHH